MTQSTKRAARTQLILMVVATAVGGLMLALTGDFVIGVGAGAAVFAFARQVMKVWGPQGNHQAAPAGQPDRGPNHR